MKSIKIKFWGVRGSIPTPGQSTTRFGGNTPCIEVQFNNGPLFILDAGTGIRELGKDLLNRGKPVSAYIFISHFHWDHIQGLPFFRPAHDSRNRFTIIGSDDTSLKLDQIISFQMDPTYFPIAIQDMAAQINFRSVTEENFEIEGVEIQTIYLNHPGYALGYKFRYGGRKVIYISDNEPFQTAERSSVSESGNQETNNLEDMFDNFVEDQDRRIIEFCRNADVLIHDTQFFPEEYEERITWGHSPYSFVIDLAMKCKVKQLILFHHDPDHDDDTVEKIQMLSREMLEKSDMPIECDAAREGMQIEV